MNNTDPKRGSTQSSWARTRNNLKVSIESLNQAINDAQVSGHTGASGARVTGLTGATTRKTARHKPYTKRKAARKLAANRATSTTAYEGPQLPLPSPSINTLGTISSQGPVNVEFPEEVPEWLLSDWSFIANLRPNALLVVAKKVGQDELWYKCCDCDSYHETDEYVRSIRILEHLNSGDHLHNVNLRLSGQHGFRIGS